MKNFGFTLAEVLITLGVIGVVAAITMPTLVQKHQEKVTVNKVLKSYSLINQAYQLAKLQEGEFSTWFSGVSTSATTDDDGNTHLSDICIKNREILMNTFSKYLKSVSILQSNNPNGKYDKIFNLNGDDVNKVELSKMVVLNLADGTSIIDGWVNELTNCSGNNIACGDFAIDINGVKNPPNAFGKDIFYFSITAENILPMGLIAKTVMESGCNLNSSDSSNGYACTRWIIQNKNMDYLHCNDLTFNDIKCP